MLLRRRRCKPATAPGGIVFPAAPVLRRPEAVYEVRVTKNLATLAAGKILSHVHARRPAEGKSEEKFFALFFEKETHFY